MASKRRNCLFSLIFLVVILGLSLAQHPSLDSSKEEDAFAGINAFEGIETTTGRNGEIDTSTVGEVRGMQRKFGELPEMGVAREIGANAEVELNRRIPEVAADRPIQRHSGEDQGQRESDVKPHLEGIPRFVDLEATTLTPGTLTGVSNATESSHDRISVMLSEDNVKETNETREVPNANGQMNTNSSTDFEPSVAQISSSELPSLLEGVDAVPTSTEQSQQESMIESVSSAEHQIPMKGPGRLPAEVTAPDPFQTTLIPPINLSHSKQVPLAKISEEEDSESQPDGTKVAKGEEMVKPAIEEHKTGEEDAANDSTTTVKSEPNLDAVVDIERLPEGHEHEVMVNDAENIEKHQPAGVNESILTDEGNASATADFSSKGHVHEVQSSGFNVSDLDLPPRQRPQVSRTFDVESPAPGTETSSTKSGDELVITGGKLVTMLPTTDSSEVEDVRIGSSTPFDESVIAGDKSVFSIDQEPHQTEEESETKIGEKMFGEIEGKNSSNMGVDHKEDLVDRTGQQGQGQSGSHSHEHGHEEGRLTTQGMPQEHITHSGDKDGGPTVHVAEPAGENGGRRDGGQQEEQPGQGQMSTPMPEHGKMLVPGAEDANPPVMVPITPKTIETTPNFDSIIGRTQTDAVMAPITPNFIETTPNLDMSFIGSTETSVVMAAITPKSVETTPSVDMPIIGRTQPDAVLAPVTSKTVEMMPDTDIPIFGSTQTNTRMDINNEAFSTTFSPMPVGEGVQQTVTPRLGPSEPSPPVSGLAVTVGEEKEVTLPDLPTTTKMSPKATTEMTTEATTAPRHATSKTDVFEAKPELEPEQKTEMSTQKPNLELWASSRKPEMSPPNERPMEVPAVPEMSTTTSTSRIRLNESMTTTTVMSIDGRKEKPKNGQMETPMPKPAAKPRPELHPHTRPEPATTPFVGIIGHEHGNSNNDNNANTLDEQTEKAMMASTTVDPTMRELELAKAIRTPFSLRFPTIQFRPDFVDTNSGQFRKFREQIANDMRAVLTETFGGNFLDFELIALRKGSVIVDGRILTREELVDPVASAARLEETIEARKGGRIGGNEVDPKSIAIDGVVSNGVAAQTGLAKGNGGGTSIVNAQNTGYIIIGGVAVGVLIIVFAVFAIIVFGVNNRRNNGTLKLKDHEIAMVENGRSRGVTYSGRDSTANGTTNSNDGISLTGYGRTPNGTARAATNGTNSKATVKNGKQTPMVLSGSQFVSPTAFRS